MENKLKQRFLGVLVLVILLGVVLLLLFTGTKHNLPQTGMKTTIPEEPAAPIVPETMAHAQENVWAVQLASFAEKSNADKLIKKLQDTGFDAYITAKQEARGIIYKVYVGPEDNKSSAENLLQKLKDNFRLSGIIVKYKV